MMKKSLYGFCKMRCRSVEGIRRIYRAQCRIPERNRRQEKYLRERNIYAITHETA